MLTVKQVADHWQLRPETIRRYISDGELPSIKLGDRHRVEWPDVWALEDGTFPRGARLDRYRLPLMSKRQLAKRLNVSIKTAERWIDAGLPTRSVFGSVRMNREDAREWLMAELDVDLPEDFFDHE
mgnify:CR=1 FL=1